MDHPPLGSKDLADALAGVVYGLTMRCEVWWQHEVNPFEVAPRLVESVNSRDREAGAPSAKPPELAARVSLRSSRPANRVRSVAMKCDRWPGPELMPHRAG